MQFCTIDKKKNETAQKMEIDVAFMDSHLSANQYHFSGTNATYRSLAPGIKDTFSYYNTCSIDGDSNEYSTEKIRQLANQIM